MPSRVRADARTSAERASDHAALARLRRRVPAPDREAGASDLGELEVREGGWRVRLRRPSSGRCRARSARGPSEPAAASRVRVTGMPPAALERRRGAARRRASSTGTRRADTIAPVPSVPRQRTRRPPLAARRAARSACSGPVSRRGRPMSAPAIGSAIVDVLGVPQEVRRPSTASSAPTPGRGRGGRRIRPGARPRRSSRDAARSAA